MIVLLDFGTVHVECGIVCFSFSLADKVEFYKQPNLYLWNFFLRKYQIIHKIHNNIVKHQ